LSYSHGNENKGEVSHGVDGKGRSSPIRLLLLAVVMVGFAVLTWGTALFFRGGTGIRSTGTNITLIFIPAWLTLTIATVVISMWFTKRLMEAERSRDNETVPEGAPPHSH